MSPLLANELVKSFCDCRWISGRCWFHHLTATAYLHCFSFSKGWFLSFLRANSFLALSLPLISNLRVSLTFNSIGLLCGSLFRGAGLLFRWVAVLLSSCWFTNCDCVIFIMMDRCSSSAAWWYSSQLLLGWGDIRESSPVLGCGWHWPCGFFRQRLCLLLGVIWFAAVLCLATRWSFSGFTAGSSVFCCRCSCLLHNHIKTYFPVKIGLSRFKS